MWEKWDAWDFTRVYLHWWFIIKSEVPSTVFPTLMDWIFQNDHGRSVVMNKGNVVPLFSCGKYLDISGNNVLKSIHSNRQLLSTIIYHWSLYRRIEISMCQLFTRKGRNQWSTPDDFVGGGEEATKLSRTHGCHLCQSRLVIPTHFQGEKVS